MSTEHQKYSTENQAALIRDYTERRGIEIVRTYADDGKSGLNIEGRRALQKMLADVKSGLADYSTILVYDVSRWGRFQDADESAYYEFLCREAGISVQYCAEQFENDGSLSATIIKSMKRAMAGEYSRELSTKVFAGQCRLVSLGFRQGGLAGYGLRRQLIDAQRAPKAELRIGEQKSLQTDRIILVPGPDEETQIVRRIFDLFAEKGIAEAQIAAILNREGLLTDLGRPWTRGTVHQILTNEKYIGHNVYNRISFKLKKKRVVNPADMHVRADHAFAAIVDPALFDKARRLIDARNRRYSDGEMLERLKDLLEKIGRLSSLIIDEAADMPSSGAYRSRFGALLRAYQLVGFAPTRDYGYIETNRYLRSLHADVVASTLAAVRAAGGEVSSDPLTDILTVNGELLVSIVIARCARTDAGHSRWKIRLDAGLQPDITIVARMNDANEEPLDYYFLPRIDVGCGSLRMAEDNGLHLDAYRFDKMEAFADLTARTPIRRAA